MGQPLNSAEQEDSSPKARRRKVSRTPWSAGIHSACGGLSIAAQPPFAMRKDIQGMESGNKLPHYTDTLDRKRIGPDTRHASDLADQK